MVPPVLPVVKFTAAVAEPLHLTWSAGSFSSAVGFTTTVLVIAGPGQKVGAGPAGVIVYVTVTGCDPVC